MKRARIIYNPASGRSLFKKELSDVLHRFEQAGYEASAYATECRGDGVKAAKLAVKRRFDIVVVAGGDGTINEVINGIAEQEFQPKLGFLPAGTTNDFARALCIPKNLQKAIDVILDGNIKTLDIGKVNDKYFANMAGGGKLTELSYEVPRKLKKVLGQLAYYLKGVEMLPSLRPAKVRISYDDKWFEGEIMLFLIANTNFVGGFEKFAPTAAIDDGLLDLLIVKKAKVTDIVRLASLALRGAHVEDSLIVYTKAKRIKVYSDEKMHLNIDGEYGGLLPTEFVNLNRHIKCFVPKEFGENET